jgi:hypothetical protein
MTKEPIPRQTFKIIQTSIGQSGMTDQRLTG